MNDENEKRRNVRRLAYCLYERKDDTNAIAQLARILHYMPEQLRQDINDLEDYTSAKVREDDAAAEDD